MLQTARALNGVVSAVLIGRGEWADPGMPVIELLDTTLWRVETRNIGELNIGRVQVGQEALVQVIAFRDHELRGHLVAISPTAIVQQGDTTYPHFAYQTLPSGPIQDCTYGRCASASVMIYYDRQFLQGRRTTGRKP